MTEVLQTDGSKDNMKEGVGKVGDSGGVDSGGRGDNAVNDGISNAQSRVNAVNDGISNARPHDNAINDGISNARPHDNASISNAQSRVNAVNDGNADNAQSRVNALNDGISNAQSPVNAINNNAQSRVNELSNNAQSRVNALNDGNDNAINDNVDNTNNDNADNVDGDSSLNERGRFRTLQPAQASSTDDPDRIVLTQRPINMTRRTVLTVGPAGIPVIRDIIIIETEASFTRLFYLLGLVLVWCTVMHCMLFVWERQHARSCRAVVGLIVVLFPFAYALLRRKLVFLSLYVLYNVAVVVLFKNVYLRPIDRGAPRRIYTAVDRFFFACSAVISACVALMAYGLLTGALVLLNVVVVVFIYAIYFAVLSQEIIGFNAEIMAVNAGYYGKESMPSRVLDVMCCALCDQRVDDGIKTDLPGDTTSGRGRGSDGDGGSGGSGNSKDASSGGTTITSNSGTTITGNSGNSKTRAIKRWLSFASRDTPITLSCSHKFHQACIKGWYLISKKEFCPLCKEKTNIDLKSGDYFFKVFMEILRRGVVFWMVFVGVVLYGKI